MNNKTKGFTLIELLVVISIISLLSSIVLSSVQDARNKAKLATVKETSSQLRTQAALYLSKYNDYGVSGNTIIYHLYQSEASEIGFFDSAEIKNMIDDIKNKINSSYIWYAINENSWAITFNTSNIAFFNVVNKAFAISAGYIGSGNYICIDSSGNLIDSTTEGALITDVTNIYNNIISCN